LFFFSHWVRFGAPTRDRDPERAAREMGVHLGYAERLFQT
jgi:hypothetical protein